MTHDELLEKIDRKIELWEDLKKQTKTAGWYEPNDSYGVYCSAKALRAVVELCSKDGYTTWNKSMVPMIDGVYDQVEADKWEEVHGHDIRLKCYAEFGCQLLLDPQHIVQAIEEQLK